MIRRFIIFLTLVTCSSRLHAQERLTELPTSTFTGAAEAFGKFFLTTEFGKIICMDTDAQVSKLVYEGKLALNAITLFHGKILAFGNSGLILCSADSGISWTRTRIGKDNLKACTVTADQIFVCGEEGVVLRADRRGINWVVLNSTTKANLNGLTTDMNGKVYCVGDSGFLGYISNDQISRLQGPSGNLSKILCLNVEQALVVCENSIFKVDFKSGIRSTLRLKGRITDLILRGTRLSVLLDSARILQVDKFTFGTGRWIELGRADRISTLWLQGEVLMGCGYPNSIVEVNQSVVRILSECDLGDSQEGCGFGRLATKDGRIFVFVANRILESRDKGYIWRVHQIDSGYENIVDVWCPPDQNVYIILTDDGKLFEFNFDTHQMKRTSSLPPDTLGYCELFFTTCMEGYVVGRSSIYQTSDAAQSWHRLEFPSLSYSWIFTGMAFATPTQGWVLSQSTRLLNKGQADSVILYRTTDKGFSWSTEFLGCYPSTNGVTYESNGVGFVFGDSGVIISTSDFGKVWRRCSTAVPFSLKKILRLDSKWVAIGEKKAVWESSDQSSWKWSYQTDKFFPPTESFEDIAAWEGNSCLILSRHHLFALEPLDPPFIRLDATRKMSTPMIIEPMPVSETCFITIEEATSENGIVRVYDLLGRMVTSLPLASGIRVRLDVSSLLDGEYLLTWSNGRLFSEQRVIVLHRNLSK